MRGARQANWDDSCRRMWIYSWFLVGTWMIELWLDAANWRQSAVVIKDIFPL